MFSAMLKKKEDLLADYISVYCVTFSRGQEKTSNINRLHCYRQLIPYFLICYQTFHYREEEQGREKKGRKKETPIE